MKEFPKNDFVLTKQPCLDTSGCGSSDARAIREDGSSYCFSCSKNFRSEDLNVNRISSVRPVDRVSDFNVVVDVSSIGGYPSFALGSRKISRDVVDFFQVKMSFTEDRTPEAHYYPYTRKGEVASYKVRTLPKKFHTVGDFNGVELFGQSHFNGGRKLVITEGELDALSVAEAFLQKKGTIYPVVSVPSASSLKVLLDQREWLKGFDEIVLFFDQDEAGQAAVEQAAKLLPTGKVKVVKVSVKDASDLLTQEGAGAVYSAIWSAQTWSPAGIVVGDAIWDAYKKRQETESVPYPECLGGLNEKLKGIRQGEITLFTSGTGSGKSTVIKEIVLHLLEDENNKVGMISLEESVADTAEKFFRMYTRSEEITEEQAAAAHKAIFKDERLVLLDHQGSVGDSSLIDQIEYMAQMGCQYLILDHITIAVSEGAEGLTGNEAIDKVMSDLLKITKRYNIWLGVISHLRKSLSGKSFEEGQLASIDDIKGSGSIKQISFDIIAFARNLVADNDVEKNTVHFRVLKSRFTGHTGDAGSAYYDHNTTRLTKAGEFNVTQ